MKLIAKKKLCTGIDLFANYKTYYKTINILELLQGQLLIIDQEPTHAYLHRFFSFYHL